MPEPVLTPQQDAFIEAARGKPSICLSAVAGAGKTFTLRLAASAAPGGGIATSFSRSTVKELASKMPAKFTSRTMHGSGLDAIQAKLGKCVVDKSNDKTRSFIKKAIDAADESWQLITPILSLVEKAMLHGIVPGRDRYLLPDTEESWAELADTYDLPFSELVLNIARDALKESTRLALKERVISFPDMLYIPTFFPFVFTRAKTLIIDEAQDLSPLQHEICSRLLMPGGRVIAAGDRRQAIYGFAGAMSNSFDALASRFSCTEMPLTVSFRCAQSIVREAQRYAPEIEAAPSAPMGEVLDYSDGIAASSISPVILCRNNSPLVKLALRFLAQGISAEVSGRDIGKGLVSLTKKLATGKSSDAMSTGDFASRVISWAERESNKKPRKKAAIQDRADALLAICSAHSTLGAVRRHIENLFTDPGGDRRPPDKLLSSIHKAKGLEWPHVAILDPHLIPSKYATKEEELQQEGNLAYVGITRAQQTLSYIYSEEID
jgi:superfamily I DNA/RNA helicase